MVPSPRLSLLLLGLLGLISSKPSSAAERSVSADGRVLQEGDEGNSTTPTASPIAESSPTTAAPTQEAWSGCVDPTNPDAPVMRLARTTICLTVGPGGSWNRYVPDADPPYGVEYQRYSFQPVADEYSYYRVPDSFKNFIASERFPNYLPNITIFSSSGKRNSFLRHWYEKNEENLDDGKIFPYLTAIVDVRNGVVQGITWDDACIFCGSGRCLENSYDFNGLQRGRGSSESPGCYFTYKECVAIQNGDGDGLMSCDLELFVVWTGTDGDGNVMSSSNSRFSAFEPRSIQKKVTDSISSVSDSINDAKDSVTGTIDDIGDQVSDLNPFGGDGETEEEGAN